MKEIILALVVAIIGFSGAYFGATISSNNATELAQLTYNKEIIQQRIKLIDRVATIYGKAAGVQDIWNIYLNALNDKNKSIELSKVLAEYNSEFNAVIHLSEIYFGPKTKEALTNMTKLDSPWWNKDKDLVSKYLGAMSSELQYGIK